MRWPLVFAVGGCVGCNSPQPDRPPLPPPVIGRVAPPQPPPPPAEPSPPPARETRQALIAAKLAAPVFPPGSADADLSAATVGSTPAPFGVFAGLATATPIAEVAQRATATERRDWSATMEEVKTTGWGDSLPDSLGMLHLEFDPRGRDNDGLYAATGVRGVIAKLVGDPLLEQLCYVLPLPKVGVLAQAWQAHAIDDASWLGDGWRADVVTGVRSLPGWDGLTSVCLSPVVRLDVILRDAPLQLGRQWTDLTLGAAFEDAAVAPTGRYTAEVVPARVAARVGRLDRTELCDRPSAIRVVRDATDHVSQVELTLCVDDEAAHQRAFAAMEQRWGRAKTERTDDGRVSLVFRPRGFVVVIAKQGERGDAEPFELVITKRGR